MQRKIYVVAVLALGLALTGCNKPKTYAQTPEGNAQYLTDNKAKPGVKTLADGLQYRVITKGTGNTPTSASDVVTVTYKGWTVDGKVFDQTQPGETAQFQAGRLIPGWVEALQNMQAGDEWEIVVPAELGYGADSPGPEIPPNATLVFQMKLISVKPVDQLYKNP